MNIIFSRKKRLSCNNLAKDAAYWPHINSLSVFWAVQQELGRSVPPRNNILHHEVSFSCGPCEAKIPNFQITFGIQQQVARPEVSMQDIRRVDVLQSSKQLIDEVLQELDIKSHITSCNLGALRDIVWKPPRNIKQLTIEIYGSKNIATRWTAYRIICGENNIVPDNDQQLVAGLIVEGDEDRCPSTRKRYRHHWSSPSLAGVWCPSLK